jgi:hypothetical protein
MHEWRGVFLLTWRADRLLRLESGACVEQSRGLAVLDAVYGEQEGVLRCRESAECVQKRVRQRVCFLCLGIGRQR